MERVLKELSAFHLDALDEDWVQAIYHSEFLEIPDLPSEYEVAIDSVNITTVFQNLMKAIDNWLENDDIEEENKNWAPLSHQVRYQRLLAVLSHYIIYGTKNVHTKEYRNNAMLSSRVYFKLLSIPGFKAYHIYHSQLFTYSLGCLGFPREMCEHDENYVNTKDLTREVNSLIRELRPFVLDLNAVVQKLQLQPSDMNFEDILSNLVDITGGAIVNKLNIDKLELAKISMVIYQMVDVLLQDSSTGEPNPVAINLLFKSILPKLVVASSDTKNSNNLVRASYVTYTGILLSKYGKAAISGFTILLQHLCYTAEGLERAEARQARVSLVAGLMSLLPRRDHKRTITWLLTLATTARVNHRHVALEMLSHLLSNEAEDEPLKKPEQKKPEEKTNESNPETGDTANPDPAKEGLSNPEDGANSADADKPDADKPDNPESASAVNTEDESSQDSQLTVELDQEPEPTEEEVAGLLRQRAHKVPHAQVLRAIYERAHDASSSLRARALNILADCVKNERPELQKALKELDSGGADGAGRLLGLAARGAGDERAVVRRAALHLLQRLWATQRTSAATDVIVSLCRDASVLVRSAAIAALGELAIESGSVEALDAFLAGPLHQLSDPETKIQEQVTQLIQNMIFDRIQKYDGFSSEEQLPWSLLEAVQRHHVRRHLQKACTLLAKNTTCVSHRVVDIASTHLGHPAPARRLQALALLTAVARHVDYSDTAFLVDYYYKITEDIQNQDCRVLPMVIELIAEWEQWILGETRSALRADLVRRLSEGGDGCRIELAALAAHLDPDSMDWVLELIALYVPRALASRDAAGVAACVCVADLALVSPRPPPPALQEHLLSILEPLTENTAPLSEEEASTRGAAAAALGRLCVRSRPAAAAAAPALARVLCDSREPPAPRANALLALADICARYTCIVEPLLGSICGCLARTAPLELRRAASRAITRLLLGAYLRLRTPLYYRYCALLADEEADVREPAEYYVTACLPADTVYQHFVDCVLHYNSEHEEGLTFDERQLIYDVMLQRMSPVQKLNTQCRLAREVLHHAADMADDGELPEDMNAALLDTITLLCGPRLRLPPGQRSGPVDGKPEKQGEADLDDLQERVTSNIVSHKMKRTVAEVLVPGALRLYAALGARGGQLPVYLVRLASDLLRDYRQEIEELIDNDEELVGKIRHFQETIGEEPSFGNARNLVTRSAPPEPDTPRAPKRRRPPKTSRTPRAAKRTLRVDS